LKILLAVDGSRWSEMATKSLTALQVFPRSQVTVMTVVPEHTFLGGLTLQRLKSRAAKGTTGKAQDKAASKLLQGPVDMLLAAGANVETLVTRGNPAQQIVKQAHEMHADLVAIGAKGITGSPRFPLGGVAHKVVKYADTSVLLAKEGTTRVRRVLLAIDGSKYSDAAARFLLALPLPRKSRVFLVTSLESHVAALLKMPTLDLETNRNILLQLQEAEEQSARSLMGKTHKLFQAKKYDTELMVLRGEPAEQILVAARTLNPELVVVGAKGVTGIETFLLGSVAQRVARFSRYSVLIVRARRS